MVYTSYYGYATDLGKCTKTLYSYNDSTCITNNWMKTIVSANNNGRWLLNPGSYLDPSFVWYIDSSGIAFGVQFASSSYIPYNIIPNLYLNSDVGVKNGTGTSDNPYQLSAN